LKKGKKRQLRGNRRGKTAEDEENKPSKKASTEGGFLLGKRKRRNSLKPLRRGETKPFLKSEGGSSLSQEKKKL